MTELERLVDRIIETIGHSLTLDMQPTVHVRESFANPRLPSNTLSLEKIKQKIADPDQEKNPDRPLLTLLLKTVDLIHPFTCNYIFLNQTQQRQIHAALLELLTTLKSLFVTHENSVIQTNSGSELSGFLIDEDFAGYTKMGELISNQFTVLLQFAKHSPDELSQKITDIINAYQKEVEPDFLRAENKRLTEEVIIVKALAAEQQKQIQRLTAQYITDIPRLPARENEQQRPTNPTHAKQPNEACFGLVDTLKTLGFLSPPAESTVIPTLLPSETQAIQEETRNCWSGFAFDY